MITHHILDEILGWYGAVAILVAYGLLTFGIFTPTDVWYHLLNATGAAGIVYISIVKKAWPPAALNVAYIFIAVFGMLRAL